MATAEASGLGLDSECRSTSLACDDIDDESFLPTSPRAARTCAGGGGARLRAARRPQQPWAAHAPPMRHCCCQPVCSGCQRATVPAARHRTADARAGGPGGVLLLFLLLRSDCLTVSRNCEWPGPPASAAAPGLSAGSAPTDAREPIWDKGAARTRGARPDL